MNPTMYLFLNRGARMSTGKAAAQAAHAAVEAYTMSSDTARQHWRVGGHYKKLVMEAQDETHLLVIRDYIEARGFHTALIIDEGLTEVRPHTATALGVQIVNKDDPHVAATFAHFKLYREVAPRPAPYAGPQRKWVWSRG